MTELHHPTTERLEAYVEGLLEEADRVVIESHLLGCSRCHHEVDEWLSLFAALSDLPGLEPSPNFADRVMARVRISPRSAWQEQAARLGRAVSVYLPETTLGWTLAAVCMALPLVLTAGIGAWVLNNTNLAPQMVLSFLSGQLVDGARGAAAGAIAVLMQNDIAAWLVTQGSMLVGTAGVAGIGALLLTLGLTTTISGWILYRNLFRTPSGESKYALFTQ